MLGKSSSSARSTATESFLEENRAYVYLSFFFIVFI